MQTQTQTAELEIVDENEIPSDLQLAIKADAPDFEEIILTRKKLLKKVENFTGVDDINDTVRMDEAKRLRLDLVKTRTGLDRIRKEVGAKWRKRWEAINETFRPLLSENESAEEFLRESEEFAVRYEASRKAELAAERRPQLEKYTDPSPYDLGSMTDSQWQMTLNGARAAYEEGVRKQEEQARLEREQREKDRIEAEKAKAELEKERAERAKAEAASAEQRRKDAEALRAHQEKAREDQRKADAKFAEERRQRQELERQQREREEAEAAAAKAKKAEEARAKRAPDKLKLTLFADSLQQFLTNIPTMKSEAAQAETDWIRNEGNKFVALILAKAEAL